MKATVIIDNTPGRSLPGEWGLSIYIEYENKKILLDTGSSSLFRDNAAAMNLPLSEVDYGILSHAHWDHANGMPYFFEQNDHAGFYIQDSTAANCYDIKPGSWRYIGIQKGILENYPDRLVRVGASADLCPGVRILAHSTPNLDLIGKREHMYQRNGRRFTHDDYSHEQSLVFETASGLVIFNSCSHGGAANIIREVREAYPGQHVRALIGGLHLYNKSEDEIRRFAAQVRETGISYICTGHCTGELGYRILCEELGDVMHALEVGLVMEF